MVLSGLLFSYFENFWILLMAAIVGEFLPYEQLWSLFAERYTKTAQVLSVPPEEILVPSELSRSMVTPIRS